MDAAKEKYTIIVMIRGAQMDKEQKAAFSDNGESKRHTL